MPWCEGCARYWSPPSLAEGGSCPTCGREVTTPELPVGAPWHFKMLVGATVAYLALRAWQGVAWLIERL